MADLAFQQTSRPARSVMLPIAVAGIVMAAIAAAIYFISPHRHSDITIPKVATYASQTKFGADQMTMKILGRSSPVEDDFYVMPTVHIHNNLDTAIDVKDLRGKLTKENGEEVESSAVEKTDITAVFTVFPEVAKRAGSNLMLRDSTIPPHGDLEGVIILCFKETKQEDWDKRKAASATIDFYKLGPLDVELPK